MSLGQNDLSINFFFNSMSFLKLLFNIAFLCQLGKMFNF